ncbi:hypothetical protein BH11MYX2_BH11MYX2_29120 [soil metagenome]
MNRKAFVLGVAMVMLCNLVAVTLRSYAEATFLRSYGPARLPWLLIASAGGFAVATFAYDAITRRATTRLVDFSLLVVLLVFAAVSPSLLAAHVPPVVLVVGLTATSQLAGLALWNRIAGSVAGRDARRSLPRAGAAVTLGGAIAGLGAAPLVFRFGATMLPYVGAVGTVIVIFVAFAQDAALTSGGAPGTPAVASEVLSPVNRTLLRTLIAVAILEGIVATVIDLQFISTLKSKFSGDTLAAAVTLFYGGTNAIVFLLQIAAVPRLLVTRSVPTSAGIHPLFAIAWYVVFIAAPSFVAIAITRTSDQVLRAATSRTSQEIELSPLPPGPRDRWKVLLRGCIWPGGALFAALVLLAIGPPAMKHPDKLAAAGVVVAVVWFFVAQRAARRFQTALAAPLGIQSHRAEDLQRVDLETLERWSRGAGSDDPRVSALAEAALARARVPAANLADHLRHDEPAVRAALFAQIILAPAPELRGELRAAVMIEDDDRALALGLAAVALTADAVAPRASGLATIRPSTTAMSDRSLEQALARGRSRAGLSVVVENAMRAAECTLRTGTDDSAELAVQVTHLLADNPPFAIGLLRRRGKDLGDAAIARVLADAAATASRAGALLAIARVGPPATLSILGDALVAGEPDARTAIETLGGTGAAHLSANLAHFTPVARVAISRALAGAPAASALVGALISDENPDVAHAALRTALALAHGGTNLAAAPIAGANTQALDALLAHLDARDAAAPWSGVARNELDLATRRCVARVLWAAAVEAAAAGRDPATLAATARHLVGGREADRKRALDVVQEHQAGRAEILAVIERWLGPPVPATDTADTLVALSLHAPWLAELGGGEHAAIEPRLAALRRPAMFSTVSGPALAQLATRATERTVIGELFAIGSPGGSMFVVLDGTLTATRPDAPPRTIATGGVFGELAVLTHATRAATVTAEGTATVLELDRDTFAAAARRAPELVFGLAATLAGWLSPERPDILG